MVAGSAAPLATGHAWIDHLTVGFVDFNAAHQAVVDRDDFRRDDIVFFRHITDFQAIISTPFEMVFHTGPHIVNGEGVLSVCAPLRWQYSEPGPWP